MTNERRSIWHGTTGFCRDCPIPVQCPPPLHNLLICPPGGPCPPQCQAHEWTVKHNQHKPYPDDGLVYCGWATGRGVIEGCGKPWPCPTVLAGHDGGDHRDRPDWTIPPKPAAQPEAVDLVGALKASIEAARARRQAQQQPEPFDMSPEEITEFLAPLEDPTGGDHHGE